MSEKDHVNKEPKQELAFEEEMEKDFDDIPFCNDSDSDTSEQDEVCNNPFSSEFHSDVKEKPRYGIVPGGNWADIILGDTNNIEKPHYQQPSTDVEQYITVEFEVKERFKPVFKQILSIMSLFRYDSLEDDEIVTILTGLVKNINLQSQKLNWTGWRKYVAEKSIFGERLEIFKYSIEDFNEAGISVNYIEKSCPIASYMERERLNREFLECYQKDRDKDYRDIEQPTWMRLTGNIFSDVISVENIRKDPKNPFDEDENVYCTVKFPLSHEVVPVNKIVGQFIGTFAYAETDELSIPTVKFNITDGGMYEKVNMFALGNCDELSIVGFGDIEGNLGYLRKYVKDLPSELAIKIQDINISTIVDVELELNPELNESMQILDKYFDFCRKQKYISSREMMEEIIELLAMETDVTKNYINCCLGLHASNLTSEEIDCYDTNMKNFIRTLPLHLNAKAVEVLNPDKYRDENKNGLNLYDDLYDMLGYIKDIERFNYRFVPVPDDQEVDEKVFIEFKATIMGTNFEDLKYQFKKIKRNIKSAKVNFEEIH